MNVTDESRFEFQTSLGGDVALFSLDRRYRYLLVRCPGRSSVRTILWVMLNPSTADAFRNDPTLSRVVRRSIALDYDRVVVANLYALRATDPRELRRAEDPVGPENDEVIRTYAEVSEIVVAAWGAGGSPERVGEVLALLDGYPLRCLGRTKEGAPRHPLYVRSAAPLVEYAP